MFAQMKGHRKVIDDPPCPCNYLCLCHRPIKIEAWEIWGIIILAVIGFGVLCLAGYAIAHLPPNTIKHIEVNGQDCVVAYKVDGQTSTGAVISHDVAVCK